MNPRSPSEGFDASPAPAKELEPLLERYLGDHTAPRGARLFKWRLSRT
ncbi:hypothetical protein LJK87_21310 [Paenibacillus sp. P25]|nr:hypothetical protein LJK87_21310 [Paenibacillus sp. P25]